MKTFEELVLEFDIPIKDRRKYDSLLNAVYLDWFLDHKEVTEDLFDSILSRLVKTCTVPEHAYNVLRNKEFVSCDKIESKWEEWLGWDPNDIDWPSIHTRNFKCIIETQLKSFYFKLYHNAIAVKSFLFKIDRSESPLCFFCGKYPETLKHILCECEKVLPIRKKAR